MALDVSDVVTGLGAALALVGIGFTATGAVVIGLTGRPAREEATVGGPVGLTPRYAEAA